MATLGVPTHRPTSTPNGSIASFGAVSAGFAGSGSITGLAAGASSNALGVALNTATAGSFAGTAGVSFVSSGAGTTGAADLALPGQSVALTRPVYTPAVAQVNTTMVDFGIVHRGDVVADRGVSVTNAAAVSGRQRHPARLDRRRARRFTAGGTLPASPPARPTARACASA